MIWGKADDYAHSTNFRQKIDSHEDLSLDDVELAFAEGFDRATSESDDDIEWGDTSAGEMKDKGVALVGAYHRQVSPRIQPVDVQRKFSYEIEGLPVPIIGYIDLEEADKIVEWKVTARRESMAKPQWQTQARLYQLETKKPLEWHLKVRTKMPTIVTPEEAPGLALEYAPMAVKATQARMIGLARNLMHLLEDYGPDRPWPTHAPDYGWACGYCGFRPTCAWWADF